VSPIDAVIDDVLGGDLGMQERQLAADEVAYAYFSKVREAAGDQLDPAVSAQLNELVAITQAEKGAGAECTVYKLIAVLCPCIGTGRLHAASNAYTHVYGLCCASTQFTSSCCAMSIRQALPGTRRNHLHRPLPCFVLLVVHQVGLWSPS
jgi:hypothetical protein